MSSSIALSFRKIPMFFSALDGQLLDFYPRRNLAGVVYNGHAPVLSRADEPGGGNAWHSGLNRRNVEEA